VLVYEPGSSRPYVQSEVDSTRTVLASLPETGTIVDFAREQEWIDAVHGPVERRELKTLNLRTVGLSVNQAIDTGERSKLSELVRDIDSVNVLIADDPNQLNFSGQDRNGMRIGWPEMFSIPRTSVLSLANALKNVGGGQWVAKRPEESSPDDRREGFVWHAITNTKELRSQWLIAIHPNHASYDPAVGLMLDRGGKAPEIRYSQRTSTPRYQYAYESWVTHARRVRDQVAAMHGKHAKGLDWLAKRLNLSNATIAEMTELMALFHDAGKLTEEWQSGAWNWQRLKDMLAGRPQRTWEPVAHTEWAPASDRKLRTKEHQLPNHAVEGAALCAVYLDRRFGEPGLCATTAIARHHAPRADAARMSRFVAPQNLEKWLSGAGVTEWGSLPVLRDDELDACLLSLSREDDERIWPLYMYLVRRLRLADQGSLRG
jgi:CRISPR-associated endonuclease/helicase Cas3